MPKKPPSKPHRRDSTAAESANSVRHSLLHQEAGPLKLDSTCDWPDVLNQRLAQMVTRMKENGWLLQQSEEIEFNVWKHNSLHGKPHQRKIIFRKGEDEILEIIDGQKQIDITKIREVDLSHDNELTILQANHQTPTSFSFENLNTYLSFGIMFLYGLLRCHDQLQMNENLSCILVQSPNDSNHSHAISSEVKIVAFAGIPVSFTLLSHDILDFQITTLEPIWKATLIAQTLSQHNVKQLKKHQVCDICSHVGAKTCFAFTTNISGEYILELECHRNKKLKKRIPVSIKSSKFCLKHSHFCFHGDAVANANDQIFIDVHTCDMFLNPSFSGFNFELLEIQIFEVTSKSRFHWMNGQFIGGEDSSHLNIDMIQSETKIAIAFSSKKASNYDIELFYTIDDKRASLNSTDPIDSRLTCQISPSIFDHYNILFNNDSLNTSLDALSMVFTAVDAYDNEIELKNLENIEIKLRYDAPTEYLEYADFLQPNHTSIKATYLRENGPKLKASFTPAWKGVYTVVFYFKSRKISKIIITVTESACETTRLEQLKFDIQRIHIQNEKDRIQEEINTWTKNQTFRQVLNHVVEKYHPNKQDHASLLLPVSAERPEILKLYKKVVFIVHTDQSPLLKTDMDAQDLELLTCELNLVFNAVQQAYRRWKATAPKLN